MLEAPLDALGRDLASQAAVRLDDFGDLVVKEFSQLQVRRRIPCNQWRVSAQDSNVVNL